MLKTEKRAIGDHVYEVTQLDGWTGGVVMIRLGKILTPAMQAAIEIFAGGGADAATQAATVIGGITSLLERLTEADWTYFVEVFGKTSEVEISPGKSAKVSAVGSIHFAGNYMEMVEWLAFAIEVNYGGFTSGAVSKLTAFMAKSVKASPVPAPPT